MAQLQKSDLLNFIRKQSMAVISTVNEAGRPESALVEFVALDDLTLLFDTFSNKRKYRNVSRDPHVSFVIGWNSDNRTLQYEGVATETYGDDLDLCKQLYYQALPDAKSFESHGDLRFFRVKPRWIRYSDFSVDPWRISEITL